MRDFRITVSAAMLKPSGELAVLFNGGHLDGSVLLTAADATFSGPLFGGSGGVTAKLPEGAAKSVSLEVKRAGRMLSFLLADTLLHSFDVGELALHHAGVSINDGTELDSFRVYLVSQKCTWTRVCVRVCVCACVCVVCVCVCVCVRVCVPATT